MNYDLKNMLYPDSGNPLEDASILRNAVYFSTAQRAYSAEVILQQSLGVNKQVLRFLLVKAFAEFMTSTEDMVGWLFALQEWQPGNAEFSLFILLDSIKVGVKQKRIDHTEAKAISFLSGLDVQGFRKLIHIPNDDELLASGMPKERVENVNRSMAYKLEGWRKMTDRRAEQERGWVDTFNKVKHHMMAFPTQERNKEEIFIPYRIRFDRSKNSIGVGSAWLEVSADMVRRFASNAIAAQAVLHDTLAVILTTRYDERRYHAPQWVRRAFQTDYFWRR